jgi:hypothetical protein
MQLVLFEGPGAATGRGNGRTSRRIDMAGSNGQGWQLDRVKPLFYVGRPIWPQATLQRGYNWA